jgi:cell wall-associated NlpC family hydrolase
LLLLILSSYRASASLLAGAAFLLTCAVSASAHSHHHSHRSAAAGSPQITAQNHALASGNVVQAAYAFRGTRYIMGGTSRSGFDCSGFVRYILSATDGVSLPRTATEQYVHGTPISSNQLQPGDLVFFKNTYKHGISHVGIYAGGGQFIHAANAHKGVRMDSLNSRYYQSHYAGARRVLPTQMRTAASLRG